MGKKTKLTERGTGDVLYPVTHQKCIVTDDNSGVATKLYADEAAAEILNSSPEQLSVINSLATLLADDTNLANAVTNTVAEAKMLSFIDAVEAAGAVYNKDTGYFELNDLTDISLLEMREIYALYPLTRIQPTDVLYKVCKTRTLFPLFIKNHGASLSFQLGFRLSLLESIVFSTEEYAPTSGHFLYHTAISKALLLFSLCNKLRIIKNFAIHVNSDLSNTFDGSAALETVEMYGLNSNVSFKNSPKLSLESLDHMVTWRAERGKWDLTDNITVNDVVITLHPTVYAKLTPELISKATSKLITFASA